MDRPAALEAMEVTAAHTEHPHPPFERAGVEARQSERREDSKSSLRFVLATRLSNPHSSCRLTLRDLFRRHSLFRLRVYGPRCPEGDYDRDTESTPRGLRSHSSLGLRRIAPSVRERVPKSMSEPNGRRW